MRSLLICVLVAVMTDATVGARMLAVLPFRGKSHHNMFQAVLKALAERGHQVVNYSPFPLDQPVPNYTDVYLDTKVTTKPMTREGMATLLNRSPLTPVTSIWSTFQETKRVLENKKIRRLIDSDEPFDLVLVSALFAQEALLGLGHKFNAPVICLQPFGSFSILDKVSGNSLSLAYIPDCSFSSSDHMSLYERFLNAYSKVTSIYKYYSEFLPSQDEYMRALFRDPTMPPLVDMVHNISLFLTNTHPYVHYAQPYTPNIIPVGGIHLTRERKPIPQDMKKFLDEATHGVIYLSLGSILPDHLLPQEFFDNFIKVFRRLPQRVLWKTGAKLVGLPDTVFTMKWVPRQDVLAHPNIVLFLTHGGLLSQHEAINAGVPVVCVPFFGDQPSNARFYEERRIGVQMNFHSLTEETIYSSLTTVINNSQYKENMQRLSRIYRDRSRSAMDSAVFWMEYVLRHGGAAHLRPASLSLAWYQLYLLDVCAVVMAALTILLTTLYLGIRKIVTFIRRKTSSKRLRKKND